MWTAAFACPRVEPAGPSPPTHGSIFGPLKILLLAYFRSALTIVQS
jgi:hypothetical protein